MRPDPVPAADDTVAFTDVIPAPVRAEPDDTENFLLDETVSLQVTKGSGAAKKVVPYLRRSVRKATGVDLSEGDGRAIRLVHDKSADSGDQGYRLDVRREAVTITAADRAGLFNGVHTLRQLLPAEQAGTGAVVRGGVITDRPRFAYRGTMLDVARHFFGVDVVKRHIDRIAQYKINYLHLHLTDDQGWRLHIKKWPKLTSVGGRSQVDGGRGGFYTQKQYTEIVRYAAARGVTIVPEIDMPGHTTAALTSYRRLNCDGKRPEPYTGTQVGFSSLCVGKDVTYRFVRDVIKEVAELTPGPYLHIGGDEAQETSPADYRQFMRKVLPMVTKAGKRPVGWHEYTQTDLPREAVVQYWRVETEHPDTAAAAVRGREVIMSPANKLYIDMKHAESDASGNKWAGPVSVRTAYDWDPTTFLDGVGPDAVLGIEAPLWTELVESEGDIERQAFPRVLAVAEVGWTPQRARDWSGFRDRLATHGPRLRAQGVAFHPSPDVPW